MTASIDEQIAKAIEDGEFDNLPGYGERISMEKLASDENLAHRLLVDQGFALPWIETRKEIEQDWEAAKRKLSQRWGWLGREGNAVEDSPSWGDAVAEFLQETEKLNDRIDDYNLIVPLSQFQRRRYDPQAELERLKAS